MKLQRLQSIYVLNFTDNMGQDYLKVFTKKYFVMNGIKLEFHLQDNMEFL